MSAAQFVDVVVVIPLTLLLPYTRAYGSLSRRRPVSSMLHWSFYSSVAGQAIIAVR